MKILSLVILAGGKGTRLKKISKGVPKPIIKIGGKPFIENIINHYSKYNFNKIYILSGYKSYLFKRYDNKIFNSIKTELIQEKTPLGTGGALSLLKSKIKNDFILVNGDTFFNFDLDILLKNIDNKNIAHIAMVKNLNYKTNQKLNGLALNKNNEIFLKKNSKLMNGGAIYIKKSFLKHLKNQNCSLEDDILPKFIAKKLIGGTCFKNFFIDIGTPDNFFYAEKKLNKILSKKAVFLDRDGVINHDQGHVYKYNDFKFRDGVIKALKYLIKKNYYIFIVTNQAGIAKGMYTLDQYLDLNKKIKFFLSKKRIFFDTVEFCPHHINAKIKKFKKRCNFRKPGNLMIESIFKKWDVKKSGSFMIGDKRTDFLAAKKSKLRFYYVENNIYNKIKNIIK